MENQVRINHWIILILAVAHQLIGAAWYSPFLFGYRWINASGFRFSDLPPVTGLDFYLPFILSVIASVLLCYTMTILYIKLNIVTASKGIKWSFVFWFVFLFLGVLTHNLFAQRPVALTIIDSGRDCLIYVLSGLVISTLVIRKRQ